MGQPPYEFEEVNECIFVPLDFSLFVVLRMQLTSSRTTADSLGAATGFLGAVGFLDAAAGFLGAACEADGRVRL
jgi:hypothetical protein